MLPGTIPRLIQISELPPVEAAFETRIHGFPRESSIEATVAPAASMIVAMRVLPDPALDVSDEITTDEPPVCVTVVF